MKAAKRAVVLTAAAGFVVVLALARQGHPATGTPATRTGPQAGETPSSSVNRSDDTESDDDSTLGGGSLAAPSSGSPPVASHTS